MWNEKVKIEGPYHFDLALDRLAIDPLNIVDLENRSIKVPIYGERLEVVTVQAIGSLNEPEFLVTGADQETRSNVIERIYSIFQWNIPLEEIQEHFSKTSLKELFVIHKGTPIVLDFSLFANLVKSIIHQQVNMKFAISLTEQFVKKFGTQINGVPFYPTPEVISALDIQQLRELKLSQRKAEYIIGLAKIIASGGLNLESLRLLSDEEVIRELVKTRGIGPWTAQSFLLFGLGRPNLFPIGDVGIQNAIKQLFKLQQKPTKDEMLLYIELWQPYLSYASLYLWRSIE